MKRIIFILLAIFTVSFGQTQTVRWGDKPEKLILNDGDFMPYTDSALNADRHVKIRTLKDYFSTGIVQEIPSIDSVDGESGQFIISDGTGWLTPTSAKYEGFNAFTFGSRFPGYGIGAGSFVFMRGVASQDYSFSILGNSEAPRSMALMGGMTLGYNSLAFGFNNLTKSIGSAVLAADGLIGYYDYTLFSDNIKATYTTYPGDTTAGKTYDYYEGQIANDDNGNLMQYDGSEWHNFNKTSGDFAFGAYVPEESVQTINTEAAGTYYYFDVSQFVTYETQGFNIIDNRVVFDPGGRLKTDTIRHSVYASITAWSDVDMTTVTFAISVDGSKVQPQTRATTLLANSGDAYALTMTGFIDLPINSKVDFIVKSDKNVAEITTEVFSIILKRE